VAEPPVVFPATVALPVLALWTLVLVTLKLLLLVTSTLLTTFELMVLLESGPVSLMSPVVAAGATLVVAESAALLSTVADALKSLELLESPDVALPPVVLWYTPALPLEAVWKFEFEPFRLLLFVTFEVLYQFDFSVL
jgi:hypothetical protein